MATIQDVARQAGVSISTVSRVINGTATVTPEVAARVQAVIQALNYRPSSAARAMRAQRSKIIGILISDIQNPFFTGLIRGVEDVAQLNGCSLILCNSDEDPQKERRYVEVLCAEQVAGVIIVPTREHLRALRLFHDHHIPVVAVDRRVEDREIDAVLVDNVRGAREGVAHLIENGYRRIGIVTGPLTTTSGRERLEGYRQALHDAGLPLDPAIERSGSFKEESGRRLTEELLSLEEPIDALFTANNLITMGALDALHERQMSVPDAIAMVGFDEMPWAALNAISLTTVTQPVYDLGSTAATRLFQRVQHGSSLTRQEIIFAPTLCVRGSSQPQERNSIPVRPASA